MTAYMDHKNLANEVIDDARATEIADGVHRVLDRIAAAEAASGRDAGSVRLLAATKTRDVGEIMAAIDAGVRMIGENRPQEVVAKAEGLMRCCAERGFVLGTDGANGGGVAGGSGAGVAGGLVAAGTDNAGGLVVAGGAGAGVIGAAGTADAANALSTVGGAADAVRIPFHLIGQLQSNKIGKVLPVVNTIESVDSIELAEKIARRAVARGITVGVLLEVNESGEESKSGCDPAYAIRTAQKIGTLDGVELQGLMTIGAHVDDEKTIRRGFAHLRKTRDLILESGESGTESCRELSMGMTGDMELAITEGSTIVRVGTAIFGERAFI